MSPTKIFGLGGMQEIGKSTLVIQYENHIFIIDTGIKFCDSYVTGVNGSIPDFTFLAENQDKIEGLFITHGHEDHIGGVPYLVQQVDVKKIFAPRIAIQYLKLKFEDMKIKRNIEFIETEKDAVWTFGPCQVDFWTAQHSIPDAFGIRIKTPNGSLMMTGDFRFDYTPIGNFTDFNKLKQIGDEGLDVLFSDSTNAMRPNHSPSESDILKDIKKYMLEAEKKIIVTAFASNLTRIKAIIELGASLNKKVVAFGRSMVDGIDIGRRLGYINVPDEVFIDKKSLSKFGDNELLILTTGSQGEELAGLAKMSWGKHPNITIKPKDTIIFSSSPIPGNRSKIELLVNRLYKLGAIIRENGVDGYLHTSGHAYKEEHRKIFELTRPKYFMPYHGEYRMSVVHGYTAIESGVDAKNILIARLGDVYYLENHQVRLSNEKVYFGPVFIDGNILSKTNSQIIKERSELGQNGFMHVVLAINKEKNLIIGKPRIVSRGAFYVKNSLHLIEEAKRLVHGAILYTIKNSNDWTVPQLKQLIIDRLAPFFYKNKRRDVVIIPTILFTNHTTASIEEDPNLDENVILLAKSTKK
ncbi:RNase J family beta-CASP ribonuclease [Metamycoplasma hominis]|uniref:ribonuclease J n=1 Tax=Metamycoplasma hominis TaxID=2098 RepID=UPI000512B316|nr:ribonuclease J [Metamycoplasma hominis]AUW37206.1 RNase J family beta-CASP ribonuclease [Metamycoplasma hominis]KGF61033.1 beta-lactamase [Metamycoplasma hominis]MBD3899119.1 ribonuclease J [Metamycoplasma hominis]MTH75522.1 RNase J family beta-CASP ribonuclease [Metamycoplasma hominis]OKL23471.1 RNase J family beta-CASP ribonuclease [Metamycoplasma hominis]